MLRLFVTANAVSVRTNGINHIVPYAAVSQRFGGFFAMFLRVKFKVYIVKKPYLSPIISFVTVTECIGVPMHYTLDRERVPDMKRVFVVFFQKLKRFISCNIAFSHFLHSPSAIRRFFNYIPFLIKIKSLFSAIQSGSYKSG